MTFNEYTEQENVDWGVTGGMMVRGNLSKNTPVSYATSRLKKTKKRKLASHAVYIHGTFNNTIFTVFDRISSKTLFTLSCGHIGLKGSRKSTAFAAQRVGEIVGSRLLEIKIKKVDIYFNGLGSGRISGAKGLKKGGLKVGAIIDKNAIPHNGTRPKKRRRN